MEDPVEYAMKKAGLEEMKSSMPDGQVVASKPIAKEGTSNGTVAIDCACNKQLGIKCPLCKSHKVVTYEKAKEAGAKISYHAHMKHWPCFCGDCGWNTLGRPYKKTNQRPLERNQACPCGSGLKYKKCCINKPRIADKVYHCEDCKLAKGTGENVMYVCAKTTKSVQPKDNICHYFLLNIVKKEEEKK